MALITALTTRHCPKAGVLAAFTIFVAVDQVDRASEEMMGARNLTLAPLLLHRARIE
jgi:hypothetical protein